MKPYISHDEHMNEQFSDPEYVKTYLNVVLEEGDLLDVMIAISHLSRVTYGMTELARRTGMSRSSLYKALSENGNPAFTTVAAIIEALGLELRVVRRKKSKDK